MILIKRLLLILPFSFGFLFASVGAGYATGYMMGYCQASGTCNICESCPKTQYTLGIGGIYLHQSKDLNSQDIGGYVRFAFTEFSPKQRFNLTISSLLGAGKHTSQSQSLFATQSPTTSLFFELRPKVGINILSQNLPLFLNLAYTFEGYNPNVSSSKYDLYSLLYQSVGGELEGLIFMNPKLRLTYSAGYDYIFSGAYKTSQGRTKFDNGSTIRASVGYAYALNQNLAYYMKLQGKIWHFESTLSVTTKVQNQYTAGIELGLEF
uniref:Outer membrane protein n=1 Tax=uncultured Helicobacter sp. TaxID=175537 RepID=A0A650EMY9_9HELI|nr:hypothetical protein Helico6505_0660 [uncultured Helicobacter sp.]